MLSCGLTAPNRTGYHRHRNAQNAVIQSGYGTIRIFTDAKLMQTGGIAGIDLSIHALLPYKGY